MVIRGLAPYSYVTSYTCFYLFRRSPEIHTHLRLQGSATILSCKGLVQLPAFMGVLPIESKWYSRQFPMLQKYMSEACQKPSLHCRSSQWPNESKASLLRTLHPQWRLPMTDGNLARLSFPIKAFLVKSSFTRKCHSYQISIKNPFVRSFH